MTDWIGGWIARNVKETRLIEEVGQRLVFQTKGVMVPVYAIETRRVEDQHVRPILGTHQDTKFIVNASKNAYYDGESLNFCEMYRVGLGEVGELMSFLLGGAKEYVQREARFVLRSLRQRHGSVISVSRANNKMYLVRRKKGDTKRVLIVADYIVTVDALRTAVDTYGMPQIIAKSNPNGSITDEAFQAASSLGVPLVDWSGLLRELGKP